MYRLLLPGLLSILCLNAFAQTQLALEVGLYPIPLLDARRLAFVGSLNVLLDERLGLEYRPSRQLADRPLPDGSRLRLAFTQAFYTLRLRLDKPNAHPTQRHAHHLGIAYGRIDEQADYPNGSFRRDCRRYAFAPYSRTDEIRQALLTYSYTRRLLHGFFAELQFGAGPRIREVISTYDPIYSPTGNPTLALFCRDYDDTHRFSGTFRTLHLTVEVRVGYQLALLKD